jgi:hypothetical protein
MFDGKLIITGQDATMTTKTSSIAEGWQPEANDLQLVRTEEERDALNANGLMRLLSTS